MICKCESFQLNRQKDGTFKCECGEQHESRITDFDFEEGDKVVIRIRQDGKLRAKFVAVCEQIYVTNGHISDKARFNVPWSGNVRLRANEADFEVVDTFDKVNF